jgi:hypothetical protein
MNIAKFQILSFLTLVEDIIVYIMVFQFFCNLKYCFQILKNKLMLLDVKKATSAAKAHSHWGKTYLYYPFPLSFFPHRQQYLLSQKSSSFSPSLATPSSTIAPPYSSPTMASSTALSPVSFKSSFSPLSSSSARKFIRLPRSPSLYGAFATYP